MNATLELDDDVMNQLRATMQQSGRSLAEVVNALLRRAFEDRETTPTSIVRKPFVVLPRPMGVHDEIDYNRISNLLEHLEGPAYR
jgi:hypothetical protein